MTRPITQGSGNDQTTAQGGGVTDRHVTGTASTPYASYDDVAGATIDTQRVTNFADGSHAIEVWDSLGNQPWNKSDAIFDKTGTLQFIKTDFDNGSWESTAYSDPQTTTYFDQHTGSEVFGIASFSEIFNRLGAETGLNLYGSNNQIVAQFGGSAAGDLNNFLASQAASAGGGAQALSAFNSDNSGRQGVFGDVSIQIGGAYGNPSLGVTDNAGMSGGASGESQSSSGGSLRGAGGDLLNSATTFGGLSSEANNPLNGYSSYGGGGAYIIPQINSVVYGFPS